jgi:hypothetical protein
MARYLDVLKKLIVLFPAACLIVILCQLSSKNTDFLCQINPPEVPDQNVEHVQQQQYNNVEASIYNRSDFTSVQLNPLKTSAQKQQKLVDNERYGSETDRRHNISQYCSEHMTKDKYLRDANANVGRNTQLVYFDFEHSFLFCQIQKVGSSTWNSILLKIRDVKNAQYYQEMESKLGVAASRKRHFLRDTMYNIPQGFSLRDAQSRLVAFTFTRNPFSRLVSAYNSKIKTIVSRNDKFYNEDIANIQSSILRRYRKVPGVSDPPYPTPAEFIQYLIDEVLNHGPLSLNPHFRPQFGLCPFCAVQFDFIGELKHMEEDIAYLGELLNIKKQVSVANMNENSHSDFHGFISEESFFKSVSQPLITDLYEKVYKPDFELLSYPYPNDYIKMGEKVLNSK